MPKRASSEPFNRYTRYHIIPRLNALTGSSVDIAGSSRGLPANLSSLVQTTVANVDMQVDSSEELSPWVVSSLNNMWQRRWIALSALNGSLEERRDVRRLLDDGIAILAESYLDLADKRFLWCIGAILSYQEHAGRYLRPDLIVSWALNELNAHLQLSGIVLGSIQDVGQAPSHPNDPYSSHYQMILAFIEKEDKD